MTTGSTIPTSASSTNTVTILVNVAAWYSPSGAAAMIATPTAEELRERERQREEQRRQLREERNRYLETVRLANQRARELLMSLVSEENQRQYEQHGYITITGSAGGQYRLHRGWQGNVSRTVNGHVQQYCAHPVMRDGDYVLPNDDVLVAQMLLIETNEPAFLAIANAS